MRILLKKDKDNERQPASLPGGDQVDGLPPAQHTFPLGPCPRKLKFKIWARAGFKLQYLST